MHQTLFMVGKRVSTTVSSAAEMCTPHSRLFIFDHSTNCNFLVDSGAAVSCFARSLTSLTKPESLTLFAANGSVIPTYGKMKLELDFGLRKKFPFTFIVADTLSRVAAVIPFGINYQKNGG